MTPAERLATEQARLDRLQSAYWAAIDRGDMRAAALLQRTAERRARLFGLTP